MKKIIPLEGCSQYGDDVNEAYKASACGPTTAYVMMNHLFGKQLINKSINEFYDMLGGTKIGLFKWRFIRNMRRYLGPDWIVKNCTIEEALAEIDAGRPVAAKFDQYFTLQFNKPALFAYHWVPLIGYDDTAELKLFIHDNGGRNRQSRIRSFYYNDQKHVLRFVRIAPRL
ncbi:MAG: C39 family peptidase [Caryophanon sp.]|nr:C39 family peptidase [Caryophanon sp.]